MLRREPGFSLETGRHASPDRRRTACAPAGRRLRLVRRRSLLDHGAGTALKSRRTRGLGPPEVGRGAWRTPPVGLDEGRPKDSRSTRTRARASWSPTCQRRMPGTCQMRANTRGRSPYTTRARPCRRAIRAGRTGPEWLASPPRPGHSVAEWSGEDLEEMAGDNGALGSDCCDDLRRTEGRRRGGTTVAGVRVAPRSAAFCTRQPRKWPGVLAPTSIR